MIIFNLNIKYDFFIDTTLLKCPWPLIEIKKTLFKLKKKNVLIKINNKEFSTDLISFLKIHKKSIKIRGFTKKNKFLYCIVTNNAEMAE